MSIVRGLFAWAAMALVVSPALGQELSLEEAMKIGARHSARLAAQRAAVRSSAEQVERAGELPDPRLRFGIENLPVSGADRLRYDRDFMTSRTIGLTQEFPNGSKREARNARAARILDLERASLQSLRVTVQRETARAWMDAFYAERTRSTLQQLAVQFRLQLDAIPSGIARGRQNAADGYLLRQAFEQANDRVIEQERVVSRARIALGALLGEDARRALAQAPDTAQLAHRRDHLVAQLDEHPEIRVLDKREELARAEVELARSTKKPDWALEVGYGQRRPVFDNMLTVMVSVDLPWQTGKRQDRDIASQLANVERERSLREDARRMHVAELQGWLANFDTARKKLERFEQVLAPLARERGAAALAAYEGGRGELGGVLDARRSATEVELGRIQALAERARAWIELNFIYPQAEAK